VTAHASRQLVEAAGLVAVERATGRANENDEKRDREPDRGDCAKKATTFTDPRHARKV
jgi:hypothetical protein